MIEKLPAGAFASSILRCIKNRRLCIGIMGVFLFLFFSLLDNQGHYKSISAVFISVDGIPFYLCFIFCAYVFADCFCEDMEYHFHRNVLVRQSLKKYVITQINVIFITSVITMTMGLLLFLCVLKQRLPWIAENDSAAHILIMSSSFRELFEKEYYGMYFFLSGVKIGLLAFCLSLLSSFISLFIKNKLLIYSTPVMIFYLIVNWGGKIPQRLNVLNIYKVFMPTYNVWENDICSFLWAVLFCFLIALLLGTGIYYRMEVLVRNE